MDLLFTADGENTAVLIDAGPAAGFARAIRVPAWRILADGAALETVLG
ncbi:hypothetical protein [Streptomyces sp. RerS4]|nr:hypothetical protein [Streptomyces sp. RerS4]UQX03397.1 hypothetical protein M4D82_25120 [Streptomyces sp. RerS4]